MTNEPPASPQIYDPAESSGIPSADPRESEERLRAVFTTTDDAIVMIDEPGVIKSINPAPERGQ